MKGFRQSIAEAMKAEWGSGPSARKEVVIITHANERAVRNWFEGRNGPSGENLVSLIRHSDVVFERVLLMSGRRPALTVMHAEDLRERLHGFMTHLDEALGR